MLYVSQKKTQKYKQSSDTSFEYTCIYFKQKNIYFLLYLFSCSKDAPDESNLPSQISFAQSSNQVYRINVVILFFFISKR